MGRPSLTLTDDSRLRVTRRFRLNADSTEPAVLNSRVFDAYLTADVKYTNTALVDQYTSGAPDQGVEVILTQVFEQITGTATRVGDIVASQAGAGAYVDTDAGGKIVSATRFAREWSVRYVLTGDVGTGDGAWHAVSSTLAFGSRTGYLTGTTAIAKANGYSLVVRRYNEIPSTYIYPRAGQYTFPGKLGYSTDMGVYRSEPSTTRQVTFEIEETYHLGEVSPLSIQYEPIYWAEGVLSYTRATGESGAKAYNFTGVIGSRSVSLTNKVFDGALCSTVSGTVASSPSTYPTGKKRIASRPSPWRGDIWKRVNTYVTFP